jgi:molybdopterin molybdotransferase
MGLKSWQSLAREIALTGKPLAGIDTVTLRGSGGRVLARSVVAQRGLPARTHAVMDGYALGSVPPGHYRLLPRGSEHLGLAEAVAVAAGEAVPHGTVSVVLADKANGQNGQIIIRDAQAKDNIRRAGEELQAGVELLASGIRLDARHAALAAAAGIAAFDVRRRPRVALLSLHDTTEALPHLAVFAALLASTSLDIVEPVATRSAMLAPQLRQLANRCDLIVVVADSLGGEDGVLAAAIAEAGGASAVHRAALKPAKPIITGTIGSASILGLAGTAYATAIAAHLFLRPLLRSLTGLASDSPLIPAVAAFSRSREPGRAEALPVHAASDGNRLVLTPSGRFGQLGALAAMDGFAIIDAESADLEAGAPVAYHPLLMPLL